MVNVNEIDPDNIIPMTMDNLTADQKAEFAEMMNKLQTQYVHSFALTRSGTVIQRYKLSLPKIDEPETSTANEGDKLKDAKEEGEPEDFKNLQDWIDYAVHHALIDQSGVLVNTLTNMIKSVVDVTITEHQARGPTFLPEGVFPQYRTLITGRNQQGLGTALEQPMASTSAPGKYMASTSAQKQPAFQPHVLTRQQPRHAGHNIPQITPEQVAVAFRTNQLTIEPIPQITNRQHTPVIPQQNQHIGAQFAPEQHPHMVHQSPQHHMGGNVNYQYQPHSPQLQYRPAASPQPQYLPQFG